MGPGRSKLSRRGPGAREQRAKEKEQERRKSQSQGEEGLNREQGRSRGMGAN